jgi:hypothetical protein
VNKLVDDFKEVLGDSLLFLRHARKAQLHRNGELIISCVLERNDNSELVITLQPSGEVERWFILRSDASKEAEALIQQNPSLKELNRATKVSVGIRVAPRPLEKGCLYAFLPTVQSSGLPLHLNADFFPEPDRKAIIFSGHQHQQAWNEMLVHAAGRQVAHDLDLLNRRLDQGQFWQLIKDAFDLTGSNRSAHPDCFSLFWTEIKNVGITASIVQAHDGGRYKPAQVLFTEWPTTLQSALAVRAAIWR